MYKKKKKVLLTIVVGGQCDFLVASTDDHMHDRTGDTGKKILLVRLAEVPAHQHRFVAARIEIAARLGERQSRNAGRMPVI